MRDEVLTGKIANHRSIDLRIALNFEFPSGNIVYARLVQRASVLTCEISRGAKSVLCKPLLAETTVCIASNGSQFFDQMMMIAVY